MTVTSIVTFVKPAHAQRDDAALSQAFALAEAHSARTVVLTYVVDVIGPEATTTEGTDEELAAARSAILARADKLGVQCSVVDRSSFAYGIGEVFADHLKVADLGVLQIDPRPNSGLRQLVNAALFKSGRPVLLVPQAATGKPPTRALVAWDGTAAAARAMHEAIPLMALGGEAIVARVSDDKDIRMDQSAIEATHHLARHGIRATFQEVQRNGRQVFAALADTARETGCDMIVCGAIQHSAAHDLIFGSVTQSILSGNSEVPVFLSA
ncbi:universal stress protein [Tabrizicola sp.]|uniref:universal stress protein n=1 Tax=Tabrizicola sp. TaxID=2005166 RepID=UPI003F39B96C